MTDYNPLYVDTLLRVASEQRNEAMNEICRLRGDNVVLRRQMADLEKKHEGAKKPKSRPTRPRAKR